jgi:hypothetical protein
MRTKEQMDKLNAFIKSMGDPNAPEPLTRYRIWDCLHCSHPFSTIDFGWSSRWSTSTRSDGKLESSNKRPPAWIKCPHCSALINFDQHKLRQDEKEEHEHQDKQETESKIVEGDQALDVAPLHLLLEPQDFIDLAKLNLSEQMGELNFYLAAWHRLNDLREIEGRRRLRPEDCSFFELILADLNGINSNSGQHALYKAEILRELERFDEAQVVLDREFYQNELESHAEQLLRAIERFDSLPFLFAPKDRDGDYEFVMEWRARRYVPEMPEDTDELLDPPIFKINNREWWIKVLGMMSHNWALIEVNVDHAATVYFFQDTPHPDRPAVIDSLNFENVLAAQQGLRRNGFSLLKKTPGPWLGDVPKGHFYDNRASGNLIYSKLGFWDH